MIKKRIWDPCVYHRGVHAEQFLKQYLAQPDRQVLLIAGAGFDPRSTRIAGAFPAAARTKTLAILLREERPNPDATLVELAVGHRDELVKAFPQSHEHPVHVFASDNAVVGGRNSARLMQSLSLDRITDIIVDISALSIGVAFPIIKHFFDVLTQDSQRQRNLHVLSCDSPAVDRTITSHPSDAVAPIHGFRGGWGLDDKSRAAILWMPQLSRGKRAVLWRIFQTLRNTQKDTVICPILPFPATNPRRSDELIEEFAEELLSTDPQIAWSVDVRDLVYADEKNPLDLYRSILRIDDARHRVFESVGGSQIILSPVGSKALSLGALMAALDRPFTILHVESIGYTLEKEGAPAVSSSDELVHIWLHGEAYEDRNVKEIGTDNEEQT
ncbi:MAG TPA: hypothetical protein PK867_17210 [Pirellulales bacterium]|nr:hypothetical protein [Pirellulales bacterium]